MNPAVVALTTALVLAVAVAASAQTATTTQQGKTAVEKQVLTGEVVQVEGNSLVVKLSTGEVKTFKTPAGRTFEIDGKEVAVGDLKPGTALTATVTTTTTPITVRTRTAVSGRVWYVAAPTVILTLANGENKQYVVRDEDKVEFVVNGRPATVFDLRKGMNVTAQKIVEAPDVEITTDTKVVGQAPQQATIAAGLPSGQAGMPATPAEAPAGQAAAPAGQAAAPAGQPEAPAGQPAAAPGAVETQPEATPAAGIMSNRTLWVVLLLVVVVVVVFFFRKSSKK